LTQHKFKVALQPRGINLQFLEQGRDNAAFLR